MMTCTAWDWRHDAMRARRLGFLALPVMATMPAANSSLVARSMDMGKYVLLGNWTDQGVRDVKNTVKRSRAAREAFAAMGVNAREWFFTLGPYDVVLTVDAPDDETLTKATLALAVQGNLRTTTMRGFGEKEMEAIVGAMA
jgi:uncharacterized protein with GYD domain